MKKAKDFLFKKGIDLDQAVEYGENGEYINLDKLLTDFATTQQPTVPSDEVHETANWIANQHYCTRPSNIHDQAYQLNRIKALTKLIEPYLTQQPDLSELEITHGEKYIEVIGFDENYPVSKEWLIGVIDEAVKYYLIWNKPYLKSEVVDWDSFYEFYQDLYSGRDYYSRAKIMELIRSWFEDNLHPKAEKQESVSDIDDDIQMKLIAQNQKLIEALEDAEKLIEYLNNLAVVPSNEIEHHCNFYLNTSSQITEALQTIKEK